MGRKALSETLTPLTAVLFTRQAEFINTEAVRRNEGRATVMREIVELGIAAYKSSETEDKEAA